MPCDAIVTGARRGRDFPILLSRQAREPQAPRLTDWPGTRRIALIPGACIDASYPAGRPARRRGGAAARRRRLLLRFHGGTAAGCHGPGDAVHGGDHRQPGRGPADRRPAQELLEPASYFPRRYRRDPAGTRDTGSGYQQPGSTPVRKPKCRLLGATSWTSITGIDGVSFAQDDYVNKGSAAEIAQEIDVYRGHHRAGRHAETRRDRRRLPVVHRSADGQPGGGQGDRQAAARRRRVCHHGDRSRLERRHHPGGRAGRYRRGDGAVHRRGRQRPRQCGERWPRSSWRRCRARPDTAAGRWPRQRVGEERHGAEEGERRATSHRPNMCSEEPARPVPAQARWRCPWWWCVGAWWWRAATGSGSAMASRSAIRRVPDPDHGQPAECQRGQEHDHHAEAGEEAEVLNLPEERGRCPPGNPGPACWPPARSG